MRLVAFVVLMRWLASVSGRIRPALLFTLQDLCSRIDIFGSQMGCPCLYNVCLLPVSASLYHPASIDMDIHGHIDRNSVSDEIYFNLKVARGSSKVRPGPCFPLVVVVALTVVNVRHAPAGQNFMKCQCPLG